MAGLSANYSNLICFSRNSRTQYPIALYIAVFDRVRYTIAQSYPPAPGCMSFTLHPPWQGGRGGAHIALHPSEIRYRSREVETISVHLGEISPDRCTLPPTKP